MPMPWPTILLCASAAREPCSNELSQPQFGLGMRAVLIPLVIHIFNRSRFKVVNWGAMHLLESVIRVNRKQVQLEQLILL